MVKFLILTLLSFSAFAAEVPSKVLCLNPESSLEITVTGEVVSWTFTAGELAVSGEGKFQKEIDTDDAFSSFDDVYALSYKSNRAVFVLADGNAVFFSKCEL